MRSEVHNIAMTSFKIQDGSKYPLTRGSAAFPTRSLVHTLDVTLGITLDEITLDGLNVNGRPSLQITFLEIVSRDSLIYNASDFQQVIFQQDGLLYEDELQYYHEPSGPLPAAGAGPEEVG